MNVIWTLILTVCDTSSCATQTIQWFEKEPQCIEMKLLHEELPEDGGWKSVNYTCTVVGAKEV
jgi:hypothetical protein|tara:strand:+ start:389 stop:577 length:189 start_codon:yes stop_codon:yes gene_type:complete